MKIQGVLCALALSLGLFASNAAASNIVVNGGFEGTTYVDSATGDILPTGWTNGPPYPASSSNVNVSSAVDAATDLGPVSGSNFIRFQSPANNGSRDCLYQDLITIPGQLYTVSFWVGITSTSVGNNLGLNPVWDENTSNQQTLGADQFYYAPVNTGPVAYQQFSFTVTASTSDTRIDFHAVDSNGSILLDDVSVTDASATPEPGTLILAGAALLGLGVARRGRRAA